MENYEQIINWLKETGIEYGPKLLAAIGLLVVGLWIIKKVLKVIRKKSAGGKLDGTLLKFLLNLLGWSLKIFLIIAVLGQLGIESTALVGILAALGLGIGLAMQGSLSNLAGGVFDYRISAI